MRGYKTVVSGNAIGCAFISLLMFAACHVVSCHKKSDSLTVLTGQIPDLSHCTRIETRYLPSTRGYFLRTREDQGVVSAGDFAHLFSREAFIIDDPKRIEAIARKVRRAAYMDRSTEIPGVKGLPHVADAGQVTCYRGERVAAVFTIKEGGYIVTAEREWFDMKGTGLSISDFTPGVEPLISRLGCARHIRSVIGDWASYMQLSPVAYPPPDRWCDTTLEVFLRLHGHGHSTDPQFTQQVESLFQCPSAGEGRCHYGMNPNCQRDSPSDTVLLFETTAGWNQHGGPELFTFDNHGPRGGLVLLNDGTVKFIRTEEELKQLRWLRRVSPQINN